MMNLPLILGLTVIISAVVAIGLMISVPYADAPPFLRRTIFSLAGLCVSAIVALIIIGAP